MHRGERPHHLAEDVVDVDRVRREAAAELAREGAAPARRLVVGVAAPPVRLGGGDRRLAGEALRHQVAQLLHPVAEAVLEDRADPAAGGLLRRLDHVHLGEALRHRLLDDDVEARLQRRDRLLLVHAGRRADVDDVEVVALQELVVALGRRADAEASATSGPRTGSRSQSATTS